ncbi:MAG TPA: NADH-quinone oxidoreductase subunit C [Vicinamibacterales bacterium]|nr:NADH-quinone oxidoreductase subunit C [Vicinamibacterales bacterium]
MTPERARELLTLVEGVTTIEGTAPIVARVQPEAWQATARFAKDTLGCAFFNFLTAIDWKAEGLEVIARLDNLEARVSVQLRTKLGAGGTACPSLVPVYRGANWMERECYDMFGVEFAGHPDRRRILLADDWEGHPLLKSYAVDTPHPPYR